MGWLYSWSRAVGIEEYVADVADENETLVLLSATGTGLYGSSEYLYGLLNGSVYLIGLRKLEYPLLGATG